MASEITYAEVKFKNESKTSGANPGSPAALEEKTSPHKSKPGFHKQLFASLLILLLLLAISFFIAFVKKMWGCCPEHWMDSNTSCYFIPAESKTWTDSKKKCTEMGAHLLVINSREEQQFISKTLKKYTAYYVGLSDLERKNHWQWIDQSPYDENAVSWHSGEPNDSNEHCVLLNYRNSNQDGVWGLNDANCEIPQSSICETMKLYL
ncbi:PREDICTED: C-type lectin domain family 4 member A isoform X2 [Elephantulus edwardii]|uniref:C-type lectin domain family 4 member A isoform X2 n=1 Tax=Elephantulus edwardii TaxID=28737 RepID=UPI0003F0A78B|nr:PREDICTED: C-type lectin domain family 4 member A isoform X2 [Elephantulus edwardii]